MRKWHGRARVLKWQPVKPHFLQKFLKNRHYSVISWVHYWKVGIIHDCYFCCCYYYTTVIWIHILQEDLRADLEVWKQDPFWDFPCFLILPNVCLMTFKGRFSRRCFWHESWGINSTLRSLSPCLDRAKPGAGGQSELHCGTKEVQAWVVSLVWVSQPGLIGSFRGHGLQEPFRNGNCSASPFASAMSKLLPHGTGLFLTKMSAERQVTL